jgi:WD40 repeat protein
LEQEFTLMGHSNWVTSVVYSPDGKYIVSGSFDLTVKVWDAQTGKEVYFFPPLRDLLLRTLMLIDAVSRSSR